MESRVPFFFAQPSTAALASTSATKSSTIQALSVATMAMIPASVNAFPKISNALSKR